MGDCRGGVYINMLPLLDKIVKKQLPYISTSKCGIHSESCLDILPGINRKDKEKLGLLADEEMDGRLR